MISLKLSRTGKKGMPYYRLVAVNKRKDPWGKTLETLGHYNPRDPQNKMVVEAERIAWWIGHGAQPTDTVNNLLITNGIIQGEKRKTVKISTKRKAKIAAKAPKPEAPKAEVPKEEAPAATEETPAAE